MRELEGLRGGEWIEWDGKWMERMEGRLGMLMLAAKRRRVLTLYCGRV
jgi:hypothetical protein